MVDLSMKKRILLEENEGKRCYDLPFQLETDATKTGNARAKSLLIPFGYPDNDSVFAHSSVVLKLSV